MMIGFDLGLSPLAGGLVIVAIGLSMILPSSPAAVGVFEAATLVALNAYGVPKSAGLSYALVLHAVNFFPYIAAGLIVLQTHALSMRRKSVPDAAGRGAGARLDAERRRPVPQPVFKTGQAWQPHAG